MAPVKSKGNNKARKSATAGPSKVKNSKVAKRPPPKQVKTKSTLTTALKTKPKKRTYTDSQLNLPTINSIIPASATAAQRSGKGTGKKKNKVYVDDREGMMTILAMVNAEKEGQIESKMIKERHLEEIREARRKEAEQRAGEKKGKFESVKEGLKKKGGKKSDQKQDGEVKKARGKSEKGADDGGKKKKRVSFAAS